MTPRVSPEDRERAWQWFRENVQEGASINGRMAYRVVFDDEGVSALALALATVREQEREAIAVMVDANRELVRGLLKKRESLLRDKRAHCDYWNCDDWGSMSGIRDAEEWVEGELAKWLAAAIRAREDKP